MASKFSLHSPFGSLLRSGTTEPHPAAAERSKRGATHTEISELATSQLSQTYISPTVELK